jgi:hypothetical protein
MMRAQNVALLVAKRTLSAVSDLRFGIATGESVM